MYCRNYGKRLPDAVGFYLNCRDHLIFPMQKMDCISESKTERKGRLRRTSSFVQSSIPQKFKNLFPDILLANIVRACFLILFIAVLIVVAWMEGRHDLSGTYKTTEPFLFDQIIFEKNGHFSASYDGGTHTETYDGKYRKQSGGQYICRFTEGTVIGGSLVTRFNAGKISDLCELAVKAVDDNILQVQIIANLTYWEWGSKTVNFYKQ